MDPITLHLLYSKCSIRVFMDQKVINILIDITIQSMPLLLFPQHGQTHSSIDHRNYFQTSKIDVSCIMWKVNIIPTYCGVAYDNVHSLARGHVIQVWVIRHSITFFMLICFVYGMTSLLSSCWCLMPMWFN